MSSELKATARVVVSKGRHKILLAESRRRAKEGRLDSTIQEIAEEMFKQCDNK